MRITDTPIHVVSQQIRRREISAEELLAATFERIEETEPCVQAYAEVARDLALQQARELDRETASGANRGPLHGIPLNVKDLFYTEDIPTRAGSRVLSGWEHPHDADAVALLRRAGAVIVGKAKTHEFAYGVDDPGTRSSWDHTRLPGGSSAGSSVSVSVGSAFGSLGTDTAGSVRAPAAANNVVGLKPTYDCVSRAGVVPMSPSLDTVGTIARDAIDSSILLGAIRREGSLNAASGRWTAKVRSGRPDLTRVRIGLDAVSYQDGLLPDHSAVVRAALDVLSRLGAEIVPVTVPHAELAASLCLTISTVDSTAWHRSLMRTSSHLYDPRTRAEVRAGEFISAVDYVQAQRAQAVLISAMKQLFQESGLDALAMSTLPVPGFARAGSTAEEFPVAGGGQIVGHTAPANVTGQPAVSVPCGFIGGRLPVGLQLIGRPREDLTLLAIAEAYQQVTDWHARRPPDCEGPDHHT